MITHLKKNTAVYLRSLTFIKKIGLLVFVTGLCIFSLTGCAGSKMNSLERQYSEKEVAKLAKQYIENKYGETPMIRKVEAYDDICGGIDATHFTAFKGFAIETDDYLTFIDFFEDGNYSFSDNKQSKRILEDMREILKETSLQAAYLSMPSTGQKTGNGNTELPYLMELDISYETYYDGNLTEVFNEDSRPHPVYIYLDASDDRNNIVNVINAFKSISPNVTVIEFEPGLYSAIEDSFEDWDYMRKLDNSLYYRRRGKTQDDSELTEVLYQKIMDGVFVKSKQKAELYRDVNEGLKQILLERPDSVEAMYTPDGSEEGIIVSSRLAAFYVLESKSTEVSQLSFYRIGKEGRLFDADEQDNEILNNYTEISEPASVIFGGDGYLIIKKEP